MSYDVDQEYTSSELDPENDPRRGISWKSVLLIVICVVVFAGIVWFVFNVIMGPGEKSTGQTNGATPVIESNNIYKTPPLDQGGATIPNQDLQSMNNGSMVKPLEPNQNPNTESPKANGAGVGVTGTTAPAASPPTIVEKPASTKIVSPQAAFGDSSETKAAVKPKAKPQPKANDLVQADNSANGEPKQKTNAKKSEVMKLDSGAWRVQLMALQNKEKAEAEWQVLRNGFTVLQNQKHRIEKAEKDGKPIYRLQVGPFANQNAANAVCLALKDQQQNCTVIPPQN